MRTLNEFISGKGFERYQSGLKIRFHGYGYTYKYEKESNDIGVLSIRFETQKSVGCVLVKETGELLLSIKGKSSNEILLEEKHFIKSAEQFFSIYPKVFSYLRDNT